MTEEFDRDYTRIPIVGSIPDFLLYIREKSNFGAMEGIVEPDSKYFIHRKKKLKKKQ